MNRNGSALILVLGLTVLLSFLILGFGNTLRSDLKAASAFYDEAINTQLARSAYALAVREMGRGSGAPYADQSGNLYFVSNPESYEQEIEVLALCREGVALGRGEWSYRFIQKPFALDPNELSLAQWDRLLEVACGLENEDERAVLADCIMDWADTDSNVRENGFEEEHYQSLDPPRHCRNDGYRSIEEVLLVYGMTDELFYGYGIPARVEDGMLFGGGLVRFLVGDNSPEAEASAQYVLRGVLPADAENTEEFSESVERVDDLPAKIYCVAQGVVPDSASADEMDEFFDPFADDVLQAQRTDYVSRHLMLVVFELPEDGTSTGDYIVTDFQENAAGSLLDAVLAYGVSEENEYGFE